MRPWQTVTLSNLSGGKWPSAEGSYTVQASGTDANHCAINLNSTSLGTLSAATITYTGSAKYVSFLIRFLISRQSRTHIRRSYITMPSATAD
jgi:hypothetical protein